MDTYPPPAPGIKNSGLAIWSLVLGILGLVLLFGCIGILFAIPAVICGHVAYGRIKRSAGALGGESMAMAGLIIGYLTIGLGVFLIPFMAAIAIPNFVRARDVAQRNACINNLRLIDAAKQQWALENNKPADAVPTVEDLNPYLKQTFESLHCPAEGVYSINKVNDAPTCSHEGHSLPRYNQQLPAARSASPTGINQFRGPAAGGLAFSFDTNANPDMHFYPGTNGAAEIQALRNKDTCVMNLVRIQSAKYVWALKNHKEVADTATADDLLSYFPDHQFPTCPDGGAYTIGSRNESPTCSISNHVIPFPVPAPRALAPK